MNRDIRKDTIAGLCFLLSGFAGLIYEVCWIRKASIVFGATSYALSTVLAVFFLGLASGSYVFGRIAQRTERPLRLFALMELAVGMLALSSPLAFRAADSLFGAAYRAVGDQHVMLVIIRIFLVSLVLLPPTFLMGGTLPLYCRQYVNDPERIVRSVGFLYGLNTVGAALGCLATGLFLLPRLGMFGAICVGVLLDIAAAVASWLIGLQARLKIQEFQPLKETVMRRNIVSVSILLFLTGFVALGNEVLWARHLSLLIRNTVYTYTLTLSAVLVGIVIGSFTAGHFFDRSKSRAFWFGLLQAGAALTTLGLMLIPAGFWSGFDQLPLSTYFFLLMPSAVLSGAAFPLGIRLVLEDPAFAGVSVGRLTAINTVGGIAGSLVVGFIMLPLAGQQSTLIFTTGLGLAGGVAAWLILDRRFSTSIRWSYVSVSVALWLCVPYATGTRLPADFLVNKWLGDKLIGYREGLSSNLAVIRKPNGVKTLEINRLWQGQDAKSHQIMAAHVPMLLRSDPHSALLVGAGAGQTASRFLMYSIDRLDCVDIEPAVFDVIRDYFPSAWMNDRRVRLLREDGRNYIAHAKARYDVISIEVGQISRPGVPLFYTSEFYELARKRLAAGGFLVQFIPLPFFTVEQFRSAVATFIHTFPQSFLWFNREELLLIGVNSPKLRIAGERLVLLEKNPQGDNEVRHDMRMSLLGPPQYGLQRLPVFLGGFITGPDGLRHLSSGAPLFHDDRPVLDYAVSHIRQTDTNEIPITALLRQNLEPPDLFIKFTVSPGDRSMIEEVRKKNLDFLVEHALERRREVLLYERLDRSGALP
jgi:spermidine synthase